MPPCRLLFAIWIPFRWPFWRCSCWSGGVLLSADSCPATASRRPATGTAGIETSAIEWEHRLQVLSLLVRAFLREGLTAHLWKPRTVKKVIVAGCQQVEISIEVTSLLPTERNIQICAVSAPTGTILANGDPSVLGRRQWRACWRK